MRIYILYERTFTKGYNALPNEIDERAYEVEFFNCVIDKSQDYKVIDADSHFADFTGVHISKIRQGKLFLRDIINPPDRQAVLEKLCRKNSPYIYMDFDVKNSNGDVVFVHCSAQNDDATPLCRLVFADVSKSREKTARLQQRASEIKNLIDLVEAGVCVFRVTPEMHFEVMYMNTRCCRLFGTSKERYSERDYRLDELIHYEDKTLVYQAIGRAMATGEPMDMESRIKRSKNEAIWCHCNANVHHIDEQGNPVFHAVFTDVTRIKKAETNADRAYDKLANIFENLNGAVFTSSAEKLFSCDLVSSEFLSHLGYTRAQFAERFGKSLAPLIDGDAKAIEDEMRDSLFKSGRAEAQYTLRAKGAKRFAVRDCRKLITQSDGTMVVLGELEPAEE